MSTPSSYPGSSNEPYGSAGQYPTGQGAPSGQSNPAGSYPGGQYQQPGSYPEPGQYGQYPAPSYGSQYPAAAAGARPGMVTAAAVLAFVVGGLSVIVGLLALFAGSALTGYVGGLGGVVIVFSILILAVGAVYIWAGIQALNGKNAKILVIVAGIAVVLQLLSMITSFSASELIGLAISIAIIALLLQQQSKDWFRSKGAPTF